MSHLFLTKNDIYQNNSSLEPCDFIVTHGSTFLNKLIQMGTLSRWNHAALITNKDGTILELTAKGIKKRNLFTHYHKKEYFIVRVNMSIEDKHEVLKYASYQFAQYEKYGILTIVSMIFKILFKSHIELKVEGTQICSEFVAAALEHGGVIWSKDTERIYPSDLYNFFIKKPTT